MWSRIRPAAADAAELRITLLDALGQLSPRDRAIIVLRYWEDHSVQTVAELLGLSPGRGEDAEHARAGHSACLAR